jgi:hypothetical protein
MPRDAAADLTAFVGATRTPASRTAGGIALSVSLPVVGIEFEYSHTGEGDSVDAPALQTGMFNLELRSPTVWRLRFYGTLGGGLYRERLGDHRETAFGTNVGGGLAVTIAGPFGVRGDYRFFALTGEPLHDGPQRAYVGLNVGF